MVRRVIVVCFAILCTSFVLRTVSAQTAASSVRQEPEDALSSLSASQTSVTQAAPVPRVVLPLVVPAGTPLRIALDQQVRMAKSGEPVHGKLIAPIYAFDQVVIPAGAIATGHVTEIAPVPLKTRTRAYANGNFSPTHHYQITFDRLMLPDGRQLPIQTTVSPGIEQVVHLTAASDKNKEEHKGKSAATRTAESAKRESSAKLHETLDEIRSPGKLHRLKQAALARLPYHFQYIQRGTRFDATVNTPLDFGQIVRAPNDLALLGSAPDPGSLLHARLTNEMSSATATRGTPVNAMLTEPLFSSDHHLVLPANSRLVGEILEAKPARRLHHNGDLRVVFERIEAPDGTVQAMKGNLEGMEVDRAANLRLDEEGGAQATDNKTRYLSTGFAILLAAAATHTDNEHGTTDASGDPGVRAGAGASGYGFAGSLISLAARSQPLSIVFGVYGAGSSIYANFLSRGRDVVLREDTPMEIGFAPPHPESGSAKVNQPAERSASGARH